VFFVELAGALMNTRRVLVPHNGTLMGPLLTPVRRLALFG
jgi:hypothetical protein